MRNSVRGIPILTQWGPAAFCLYLGLYGCGSTSEDSQLSAGAPRSGASSGPESFGGSPTAASGGGAAGAQFADTESVQDSSSPEVEVTAEFERPAGGSRYVYVANPTRNNVAVVDSLTREIEIVQAGERPTFLQTLGGRDMAVVLNASTTGTPDANVFRTTSAGTVSSIVPVVGGANAIAVAPDGKHAIVYYDATQRRAGMASGSFQDITVLSFEEEADRATDVTVGFRPQSVTFDSSGERALLVTEDGISIIDFAEVEASGPLIAPLVPLSETPGSLLTDVSITPDGRYALARREEEGSLRLVDLSDGQIETLDVASLLSSPAAVTEDAGLANEGTVADAQVDAVEAADAGLVMESSSSVAVITDLDLSPDGTFALAAVRAENSLLRIPLPGGFEDPTQIERIELENVVVGAVSLAPDGNIALVYTTALADERVSIVDLSGEQEPRPVQLRKGVTAVAIAPDGRTALVIHSKADGSPDEAGLDPDTQIDRSFGYTLLDMESGFPKLQLSPSEVGPFVVTPNSSHLFILFNAPSEEVREVHRVELSGFLVHREALQSPPASVGVVPESEQVFVGQEHAGGRITFFDWNTGEYQMVTGFENNSRIRNR